MQRCAERLPGGRPRGVAAAAVGLAAALAYCATAAAKEPLRASWSCASFTANDEVGAIFAGYEGAYPGLARALAVGTSVEGRAIHGLRVSADVDAEAIEPEIRIIGAIHGNECIAAEEVLAIADWLLAGYGDDPAASDLVDGAEIVLVPIVNPDGYSGGAWATRENAHGVDLNRNFGFGWVQGEGGDVEPFSEPESRAIRDLSRAASFTLGLSYHTVATYVNSAWNYRPEHPLDEALIEAMGDAYAGGSSYEVVFGWDWYMISGDVNDWSLGSEGTLDWTIELGSDTDLQWGVHGPGVAAFLAFALTGAFGTVTDADTGAPLAARIRIAPAGEPVFTDPDLGDYHRVLLPGTYAITAEANGYAPATAAGVVVPEGGLVEASFALAPAAGAYAFAVAGVELPRVIDNESFGAASYLNDTAPRDALGAPDGAFYSLSPGGAITLDLGAAGVADADGADLAILSGTGSADTIDVLAAAAEDGPWALLADGAGDLEADLAAGGIAAARYVRIEDTTDGPFNDAEAGYDLDAVVALSAADADADADTDADSDADTDADADADTDAAAADGGALVLGVVDDGCGCAAAGRSAGPAPLALLLAAQ